MAAEQYYIERKDHKHQIFGFIGTALMHGILFAILFLVVMYPPDPPLEYQGIQMSLGEENMGGPNNSPTPDPTPTEQYVPISEQTEETPLTSDEAESLEIKEKTKTKPVEKAEPKPVVEQKKPQLELPKKVNQQALFTKKNKSNEGGYGDGQNSGNEGEPDGSPDGDKDGRGKGNSGFGIGETGPDGISFDLAGRKVKQLPNIEDNSKSVGKVVVRITVNREGTVVKAVPGQVGSTTTETALLNKAKEGALKTKFYSRDDGRDEQYGTMTIIFRLKP